MKTLHDFLYCRGKITPAVCWYLVKVGTSQRDKYAHTRIRQLAEKDNAFFYAKHDESMCAFRQKVVNSLFTPGKKEVEPSVNRLKTRVVEVVDLWRKIKSQPYDFLIR